MTKFEKENYKIVQKGSGRGREHVYFLLGLNTWNDITNQARLTIEYLRVG